jgi:methionyl aminopeptidase
MTIEGEKDLLGLMRIGRIVGLTLQLMRSHLKIGMTTAELDAIGAEFLKKEGARSAPILAYKFPAATCISLNDEAAHGIPGKRVIHPGDLVNIDVSAELDGYFADTGATFPMPPTNIRQQKLCDCAQGALQKAIESARAGQPINAVGRAVETYVTKAGFSIIRDLPGHGVGRKLHEPPSVLNYFDKRLKQPFREGMVITLEPFVATGAKRIVTQEDGWTLKTPDGSLCAQYEHTVVITKDRPILVTAV